MKPVLFTLLGLLLAGGCGYSSGTAVSSGSTSQPAGYQWRSLYRPGIKTVAVETFTSRDFRRGEEFRLSAAIAKEIEAYTPYKIAPRDSADTVLEGEIFSIRRPVLSSSSNGGVPNEQLFQLVVNFTWKDLRTGKILVSRKGFEQITAYYPTLGEGSFLGSQTADEKLALAIVQQLEADW
jgi:hypothetical protein